MGNAVTGDNAPVRSARVAVHKDGSWEFSSSSTLAICSWVGATTPFIGTLKYFMQPPTAWASRRCGVLILPAQIDNGFDAQPGEAGPSLSRGLAAAEDTVVDLGKWECRVPRQCLVQCPVL